MPTFRKLIISEDDDDGVVFTTARLLVLNEGVVLSNAGTALDTANGRTDVELDIKGKIVAEDGPNAEPGIGIATDCVDATIHIFSTGRIESADFGILAGGDNLHLILDAGSRITSQGTGIDYTGTGGRLDIDGKIIGPEDGIATTRGIDIQASDAGVIVDITGVVRADRGVTSRNDGDRIINSGRIEATEEGIDLFGDETQFLNKAGGVVTAPASFGDDGAQFFTNRGEFNGDIFLGDDGDFFDGRKGDLHGRVFGEDGNDIYVVDDKATDIRENFEEGALDTVNSNVSYVLGDNIERLFLFGEKNINATGNGDNNQLGGNDGDNRLNGKGGLDFLEGGEGSDTFVFQGLGGADTVLDFENNKDRLDLSAVSGIESFNDIKAFISQDGDDTLIDLDTFSSGLSIIVATIRTGKIDATDFQF